MLNQMTPIATIAVKDLARGQEFYGDVLGLDELEESESGIMYASGDGKLFVYQSDYAGTNQATYVTWPVNDIDAVLRDLKERGVEFEHYDNIPGTVREGDVHIGGGMKSAWFKDPDGNILNVTTI